MQHIIIFCSSYGQIRYALQLIQLNIENNKISLVIPGYNDLFYFFQVIGEKVFNNTIDIVSIDDYRTKRSMSRGFGKIQHLLQVIPRERLHLKKIYTDHFANLKDSEVFFFSRGVSGLGYYLLDKLSKKNRLVYVTHPPPYLAPYIPSDIAGLISLAILKMSYGYGITMSKTPTSKGFPYLSDRFIDKRTSRVIDVVETESLMKDFDINRFRVFDPGKYSIVYFDDDLVGNGYILDSNSFKQ